MNALFLKDLAEKTHRGLRGRVEESDFKFATFEDAAAAANALLGQVFVDAPSGKFRWAS